MQSLAQANLACPVLLIGAQINEVIDFCKNYLCVDDRAKDLFAAGVHPDYCQIEPALENIRELTNIVHSKPQLAKRKVVLITHAEQLNVYAANALLKNLEEPGVDTLFILLAPHAKLLPPTVVSRCQVINVKNQTPLNHAAIGQIMQDLSTSTSTALELANQWKAQCPDEVLYCFEIALANLLKQCYLESNAVTVPEANLWRMLDLVQQANRWRAQNMQPNIQLLLEAILLARS